MLDDKDRRLFEVNKRANKRNRIRSIYNEIFRRKSETGKKLQSFSHSQPQTNIPRKANIRIFTNGSIFPLSRPNANSLFPQQSLVLSLYLS